MRTLIAAIGVSDDSALSGFVKERLASDAPLNAARVVMNEVDGDAGELAQRLNAEWPRFERVIFIGSVARERPAGSLAAYRWDGEMPNEVAETPDAETADALSFDNTLLRLKALGDLPDDVIVVEIEPGHEQRRGVDARAALDRAQTLVRRLATSARAAATLPKATLGGL